ncbi:MAG: tRNA uridine-5-carboxymethylaminomethyl(34) synthesis enzyme MnmG, partial [Clostridiales bacterium]|nr:tRNA uridine-5-carboxymethylaminomethyl(34) synthesis enzyme MnmG [Clostridiales bacterium]
KVVRFSDKKSHQIFVEPMGRDTEEMYMQGLSSSLPEEIQLEVIRSVPGCEKVSVMRSAYAIEYDAIDATELKLSLESKIVENLFCAGQINGSSGYEEAAAQGLIAGINASLKLKEREPVIIDRSEGYIGVLIDDLVTRGTKEPYRMMTSRAEYRLLLRQDNADLRLTPKGYEIGLISEARYQKTLRKKEVVEREIQRLSKVFVSPDEKTNSLLSRYSSSLVRSGVSLKELLKRPELKYSYLSDLDPERPGDLSEEEAEQVEINVKYEGYIEIQKREVEQFKKLEKLKLPVDLEYRAISNLRLEAREKLDKIKPLSIGQASRITGVSPADISALMVYFHKLRRTSE